MALYKVERTDDVAPGEFVDAFVLAGGAALARKAVAHMLGVVASGKGTNVRALKMDTTKADGLLSAYFDEREPAPEPAVNVIDTIPLFA